jgi:anti-sigma B factor antagonist
LAALSIHTEARGTTLIVQLAGEFDLSGLVDFQRELADVRAPEVTTLCIDLRGLTFMGATGLRALLGVEARSGRDGFQLVVVRGRPLVQRVFEMTGVDRRLSFIDDPASLAP